MKVATKHALRTDELLRQLQEMEQMVKSFERLAENTHRVVLNKIKANMAMVESFWDATRKKIFSEEQFSQFAKTVNLPRQLREPFKQALISLGSNGWEDLIDDVLLMKDNRISPATLPLPHLTMAKGRMVYGDLQALFDATEGLDDYKTFYVTVESRHWLNSVDHLIPHPDILAKFPTPDVVVTITLSEFRNLVMFLQRHNVSPNQFQPLVNRLQLSQQWVAASEGSTEIDASMFTRLKSAGSSGSGNIDDLATELNAAGHGGALQAVIAVVADIGELNTLLEDARAIGGMLLAGKVTPETLHMAYHGAPPAVARMALVAAQGSPQRYQQRFLELQELELKRSAMGMLKDSTAIGILAGDAPLQVLAKMGDPENDLYKVVIAVPKQISAGNPERIRTIHGELTLMAKLVTGEPSVDAATMANLKAALQEARQFVDANGRVTNSGSYEYVLQTHLLTGFKKQISRICTTSITPETVQVFFESAQAIKRHNGNRMIPLTILQAAYQPGWSAEQFHLVKIVAETPQVRTLARNAHTLSGLSDLTEEIHEMEAASAEFRRLVAELQKP